MSTAVDAPDGDEITTLFRLGLGPWLTPLRGKVPVLDAWQELSPTDEDTVRDWLAAGFNLGFRTGVRSGLVVIDDDQPRNGGGPYTPPPSGLVAVSPTGSRHYYYRAPDPCPGNSASRLAPHVDVRGEGGQVVVPPSVHPIARAPYRWAATGEPGAFPAMPASTTVHVDTTAPAPAPAGPGYVETALAREVHAVRTAHEGARNDTLNKAAFNLGQLVAGGAIAAERVSLELTAAAMIAGLPQGEAASTIRSGLAAGAAHPRTAPVRPSPTATATRPQATLPSSRDVLVPGSHVLPTGEFVEQGAHAFAAGVLAALPPGTLYRRAGIMGTIQGAAFVPATANALRSIVDGGVRLCAGKETEEDPVLVFRSCSRDHAEILLHYSGGSLRELKHVAAHPVCIGSDFRVAAPGWNADAGVYLAESAIPTPLPLTEARAVLEDLVADFPFQAAADRANFFGLMLTPILRPALDEPVPMHLVGSPMERTGKTKLVEIVFGVVISGSKLAATQIGDHEDEREKRILSWLLRGQSLVHMDNLTEFLGSAALASMLTSSVYQGRVLGSSSAPTIPNGLTVVGTGNNVHTTGEIAKRIVPIRLLPATETPETRTDFRHPDLLAYVTAECQRVLAALMGLIDAWRTARRPLHRAAFGGFERWTAVVGGILNVAGYPEWLSTMAEWRGVTDDASQEGRALIAAWHKRYGHGWIEASRIYDLAVEMDLYGWIDSGKTDRARRRVFAVRVLNRLAGRVIGLPRESGDDTPRTTEVRVESTGSGSARKVKLDFVAL